MSEVQIKIYTLQKFSNMYLRKLSAHTDYYSSV